MFLWRKKTGLLKSLRCPAEEETPAHWRVWDVPLKKRHRLTEESKMSFRQGGTGSQARKFPRTESFGRLDHKNFSAHAFPGWGSCPTVVRAGWNISAAQLAERPNWELLWGRGCVRSYQGRILLPAKVRSDSQYLSSLQYISTGEGRNWLQVFDINQENKYFTI